MVNFLIKFLSVRFSIWELSFFRALFTVVVYTPIFYLKGISFLGSKRKLLFIRSLAGFTSMVTGFYALSTIKIADAAILWKTSIIFTAFFSVIILNEKISKQMVACIIGGLVGAALIIKPSLEIVNLGGLAGLVAGISLGLVACWMKKLQETEKSITIVYGFALWTLIFATPLCFTHFTMPNPHEFMLLMTMSVVGLIGQSCYTEAFRYERASFTQPFAFSEVLFSLFLGFLYWGEIPDGLAFLGCVFIIGSGYFLIRTQSRHTKAPVMP